jgi:hypothetical protein
VRAAAGNREATVEGAREGRGGVERGRERQGASF